MSKTKKSITIIITWESIDNIKTETNDCKIDNDIISIISF